MELCRDLEIIVLQERELQSDALLRCVRRSFTRQLRVGPQKGQRCCAISSQFLHRRTDVATTKKNETLFDKYGLSLARYASHGGSFPIAVSSAGIIGSVTVSGLSQRDDHELVVEALCCEIGRDYADLALPNGAG